MFALDRNCFNNIVKDAAQKKREKYEELLSKIELLGIQLLNFTSN